MLAVLDDIVSAGPIPAPMVSPRRTVTASASPTPRSAATDDQGRCQRRQVGSVMCRAGETFAAAWPRPPSPLFAQRISGAGGRSGRPTSTAVRSSSGDTAPGGCRRLSDGAGGGFFAWAIGASLPRPLRAASGRGRRLRLAGRRRARAARRASARSARRARRRGRGHRGVGRRPGGNPRSTGVVLAGGTLASGIPRTGGEFPRTT